MVALFDEEVEGQEEQSIENTEADSSYRRSTDPRYVEWIDEYGKKEKYLLGRCKEATTAMLEAFPELKSVAGYAATVWGEREHWWLTAPDGSIVDPTAAQFPGGAVFHYREWTPGSLTRVGKCMNCGDEIWRCVDSLDGERQSVCGKECENILLAEYNPHNFRG